MNARVVHPGTHLLAAAVPLVAALAVPRPAAAVKVFLNASDQTSNPVACGGNEAQYAADNGQRARARLQAYGFDVQYSQDFTNSPAMANNWGADTFVSIHTNAGGGHGTETLYKTSAGQVLAGHVNDALVAALGLPDRGLKVRTDLHMLNATSMTAVLTEVLFHDCSTSHSLPSGSVSESCFLIDANGRVIIAEALAQGVCAHHGVTCQAGPSPHPVLSLGTEVVAIAGQPRDLVGADGVFDLLVGQETVVRFTVTNAADATAPAANAVAGIALTGAGLAVAEWHVYDNYPGNACGGDWCLNSADGNAQNPPHLDPGATFDLLLDGFSAGEAKRVDLRVRGAEPTGGAHPEVRLYVKHVDDFYEKAGWDGTPDNVGGYQTWGGGDLRIASALDVWTSDAGAGGDAGPPDDGGADEDGGVRPRGLEGGCACAQRPAAGGPAPFALALLAAVVLAARARRRW
ncbi:MAG: N-acetylmuramoyl-L-alanine amidase [Deltaproteobacteria bacterium]|nr:N-acetylmuramoyl-L-alanine amidase [Deltaproteobacteria bacterium]